jgi:hypothetical protein
MLEVVEVPSILLEPLVMVDWVVVVVVVVALLLVLVDLLVGQTVQQAQ